MTTLATPRLLLRPPTPADAPAVVRYLSTFAVAGNLVRVPYPYSLADAERWLHSLRADPPPGETGFGIELQGAGYVGQVGLHPTAGGPELGYWLGEPFWHRGLMTEAAGAVVDWFFSVGKATTLRSGAFAFNRASLAVQRKLGFVQTGTGVRHCLARGEDLRHIDTMLSRSRWQEGRP
jgi:RimJ/RimL family protein N-acetyltransferase